MFGAIEDRASTLHLPLHGGGREGAVLARVEELIPAESTHAILPPSPAGRALATNDRQGMSRVTEVAPWRAAVLSNRPLC